MLNMTPYSSIRVMAAHFTTVLRADPDGDHGDAIVGILRAAGITATPEMMVYARDSYVERLKARRAFDGEAS